jgi:hypothetical protein
MSGHEQKRVLSRRQPWPVPPNLLAVYARIWRNLGSGWTQLAAVPVAGLSPTATNTLRFDAIGSSLKLFVNGTLEASAADSVLTSGQVGIRSTAGAALANFSVN